MTWGNPPKFLPTKAKPAKVVTPEMLAGESEDSQQAALFCWAAASVGKYPQLAWMFAIPNGGSRHIAEATKMVAAGVRKGVPDIFLPCDSYKESSDSWYYGCFIELKVGKNKPSKEQMEWMQHLLSAGYCCTVCYGWIEAKNVLISYLEGKL